ncbi:MAG: SDR family oxidoreductase [Myxococcales bacterium]|nr:SDR family oxidoreductase [Myxococcales bacterium]MCB9646665.1 SDR family oxidoreductase [Deltaproteobacteria bacterium]
MSFASVFRPDLFAGQVAIVTGGGTGLGRCMAHELAALGATVVLAARKPDRLDVVRAEIEAEGGKADCITCNIREEEQVEALVRTTLERHGALHLLVNNGGGQFVCPAESISTRGWEAVLQTNLTGTFLMCKAAFNQHMEAHGGAIVNIVADMFRGMPMMAHSGAARAGVVNLTQTLALEWARAKVRVNAVAPGMIASSGFKNYPEPVQEALKTLPAEIPAQRFGTESEVSAAALYLLSPAAAYVTGVTLRVDGGSSLYRHPFTLPSHAPFERFEGFHLSADLPEGLD